MKGIEKMRIGTIIPAILAWCVGCTSVGIYSQGVDKTDNIMDILEIQLENARFNEDYKSIARGLALVMRPRDALKEIWSNDRKIHVIIGANGCKERPNGIDVDMHIKNEKYAIAIGGDGASPSVLGYSGDGGNGGNVRIYSDRPFKGILIAIGGNGGNGSNNKKGKGYNGGKGGSVICHCKPVKYYHIWGGHGGRGGDGRPGGNGGNGGGFTAPPRFK